MTLAVSSAQPAPAASPVSLAPGAPAAPRLAAPPEVPFAALVAGARSALPSTDAPRHAAFPPGAARASTGAGRAAATAITRARSKVASAEGRDDDPLDPTKRRLASCSPPVGLHPSPPETAPGRLADPGAAVPGVRSTVSLEHLLPALVRRIAWSGDGRRGTARLEIGGGELAGAVLRVDADGGRVRVQLEVPAGVDARAWEDRIRRRLADREVPADSIEVT